MKLMCTHEQVVSQSKETPKCGCRPRQPLTSMDLRERPASPGSCAMAANLAPLALSAAQRTSSSSLVQGWRLRKKKKKQKAAGTHKRMNARTHDRTLGAGSTMASHYDHNDHKALTFPTWASFHATEQKQRAPDLRESWGQQSSPTGTLEETEAEQTLRPRRVHSPQVLRLGNQTLPPRLNFACCGANNNRRRSQRGSTWWQYVHQAVQHVTRACVRFTTGATLTARTHRLRRRRYRHGIVETSASLQLD